MFPRNAVVKCMYIYIYIYIYVCVCVCVCVCVLYESSLCLSCLLVQSVYKIIPSADKSISLWQPSGCLRSSSGPVVSWPVLIIRSAPGLQGDGNHGHMAVSQVRWAWPVIANGVTVYITLTAAVQPAGQAPPTQTHTHLV